MENNNQNELNPNLKISGSFRLFLVILSILGLVCVGYILVSAGESIKDVVGLLAGGAGGILLLLWFIMIVIKKIVKGEDITDAEKIYIENLTKNKIVEIIRKYIFSDMDISAVLRFIVVMGSVFKWMFFYIFAGGALIVFFNKDTLFNQLLMLGLAIVWCPWLENIFLKKVDYKITFIAKVVFTILIFSAGIISQI
ncbi:MAG: hypothetical protein JW869_04700 [Candidatus Omnitrophica bacterium]|nr:hypothetical protein [Candidatus Omnitrophota bacterium]